MIEAPANNPRQEAMAVLSHATPKRLGELWAAWSDKPAYHKVRGPETGLVMVRGRAGGGGNAFNLGEATVTRATVRLEAGEVGHAYCLGRDGDKAVQSPRCSMRCWQREPKRVEAAGADAAARSSSGGRCQASATRPRPPRSTSSPWSGETIDGAPRSKAASPTRCSARRTSSAP